MKSIAPRIGDIIQYNGSCPITDRVTNILPDGVSICYFGQSIFVAAGTFRVISETRKTIFGYKPSPIDPSRVEEIG